MSPTDIVAKVIGDLNRCAIAFMVVGSFSSNVYGIERSTDDVDILIDAPAEGLARLAELLGPLGSDFDVHRQLAHQGVGLSLRCPVDEADRFFRVDLFVLSDDPHDRARFARRRVEKLGEQEVGVASPEDVVITKLRWSKGGKRSKDIDDVRGVLAVQQGKLDMECIREWCRRHGTLELLEKTLASIPGLPA